MSCGKNAQVFNCTVHKVLEENCSRLVAMLDLRLKRVKPLLYAVFLTLLRLAAYLDFIKNSSSYHIFENIKLTEYMSVWAFGVRLLLEKYHKTNKMCN